VIQVISAPAVQFKGSGWYVSDYARKSPASGAKAAAGSDGGETVSGGVSGSKDAGSGQEGSGKPASGSAEKTGPAAAPSGERSSTAGESKSGTGGKDKNK
jgi:hypothetical protein